MDSVWSKTVRKNPESKKLAGNKKADVLIIGGGLTGILTAYQLSKAGVRCIIAEAKSIGSGTTQNTTAKITGQQRLIYADLIKRFGIETAGRYYEANIRTIKEYRGLSRHFPCDFEEKTAYVYTTGDRAALEREADAYRRLGLAARIESRLPLPLPVRGALAMEGQAQLNPLMLLYALADRLTVYENTFVRQIDGQKAIFVSGLIDERKIINPSGQRDHHSAITGGIISADHIALATHYPLVNIPGGYFIKLYQHRSYVLGLENALPADGMYIDEKESGLSFRTYKDLLLIGGGSHKTGHPGHRHYAGHSGGGFNELRAFAASVYPDAAEKYHWAAQDCMSLDGLPYIGRHSSRKNHLYVATGFHKWGMTGAMIAANMICDLIVNGRSEDEGLFSPNRPMAAGQLAANLGSAAVRLLSPGRPRCTHMGCRLKWNRTERTWDCPCHGSRFTKKGRVIDNPAKRGLRR